MSKIMIISLDGATWSALKPLFDNGSMPYLKNAAEGGSSGTLRSVIPPVTAPAWSSFMTGKRPDSHGVLEFRCFDVDKKTDFITNASYIGSETIWQILSRHGKKVISVNVPYTYPVYDVNGILISGMDTPSNQSAYCSPAALKEVISEKFPDYIPAVKAWDMKDVSGEDRAVSYIKELEKFIDMRSELSLYLLSEYEWDVAMVHFQETDYLQHVLWDRVVSAATGEGGGPIHDAIIHFFGKIDASIKRLWKIADPDNTSFMIISDHGFTNHKGVIFPNVVLEKSGLILRAQDDSFKASLKKDISNSDNYFLKKAYLLQQKIRNAIREKRSVTIYEKFKEQNVYESMPVKWDESGAVMVMGSQYAFIYVKDKEHIQSCRDVLEKMTDNKTKEKLFERIVTFAEAYGRDKSDVNNVIIAIPREGYSVSRIFRETELKKDEIFPGIHHPDGVYIAYGNNIKSGSRSALSLIDIAPTCLHLLGLPIPSDMEGKVAQAILIKEDKVLIEEAVNRQSQEKHGYDEESEKMVKERLRSLGYIE